MPSPLALALALALPLAETSSAESETDAEAKGVEVVVALTLTDDIEPDPEIAAAVAVAVAVGSSSSQPSLIPGRPEWEVAFEARAELIEISAAEEEDAMGLPRRVCPVGPDTDIEAEAVADVVAEAETRLAADTEAVATLELGVISNNGAVLNPTSAETRL